MTPFTFPACDDNMACGDGWSVSNWVCVIVSGRRRRSLPTDTTNWQSPSCRSPITVLMSPASSDVSWVTQRAWGRSKFMRSPWRLVAWCPGPQIQIVEEAKVWDQTSLSLQSHCEQIQMLEVSFIGGQIGILCQIWGVLYSDCTIIWRFYCS